ncbi:CCA tRNA nucleotidyltransferase [Pseudooceanicola sp. MF1-13]|uniref:CCA tRNA nucleotidyltransferase n=1 Tax=Pseudooceanicola sp. MF1-13 TaxID=3379095 RepID=UPI003891BCDA
MRVTGAWLDHPGTRAVMDVLTGAGHQAFFVGGCVRDALLDRRIGDIDIATDAHPQQVLEIAKNAGIKAIPTGFDHGTVTLVSHGLAHEITTLRSDIETDGRHAVVQFSDDIADDAARRDFTMNALYAKPDGEVVDPLGGLPDLQARRLRFVGDPAQRIAEDYLRILRYFRFHAWYGDPDQGMDPDALAAIADGAEGLTQLSHERVGTEVLKLLSAPDPAPSVAAMRQTGVLGHILPGADDKMLALLVHLEGEVAPDPIRRLASLGGQNVASALRLSKADARRLDLLRDEMGQMTRPAELGYRHGMQTGLDVMLLRAAMFEQPITAHNMQWLETGARAKFPVQAVDLIPDFEGPALGARLKELEDRWISSGFTLTREQLCADGDG